MKNFLLCFTSAMLMFSCSKEDSSDGLKNYKEVKTLTPNADYESPYDLNGVDPFFQINIINNTPYPVDYNLATIVGFFDGNWDGQIDYTDYGGPIMNNINAPNITSLDEFGIENLAQSVTVEAFNSLILDIDSFKFNSKYNPEELAFLKQFSKLLHVEVIIAGFPSIILKHDAPLSFIDMDILPHIMEDNHYEIIQPEPGIPAYNTPLNQYMGITTYHSISREIIFPDMPSYLSEYYFTGPGGMNLHLYFKTYSDRIEIVLE